MTRVNILSSEQIKQKVSRIAYQIFEDNFQEKEIIVAGIAPNGFELAQRIAAEVKKVSPLEVKILELVIDKENPFSKKTALAIPEEQLNNKVIVLVDDVLNSGKTLAYALPVFLNIPIKKLRIAVLVDRNHKRFPVAPDFVGHSLSTTLKEHIKVELGLNEEGVYLS